MRTKHLLPTLLLGATVFLQLGATDCGQVLQDPGFDMWCGDRLCYWKTDAGTISRVPTWISGDDGVSFDSDGASISQMSAVTSDDGDCIELDMTANVDTSADVELELDVFGDGTVDTTQRIPTSHWEKVSIKVGIYDPYQGIRFRLVKHGPGTAVLADISGFVSKGCPDSLHVAPFPDGAKCWGDTDCASNLCDAGVCSRCATDTDCASGSTCGLAPERIGWLGDWRECVANGSRAIGQRCDEAAQCASGACNGAICEECADGSACQPGQSCRPAAGTTVGECDAGGGARPHAASCVVDGDCASGRCAGTPFGYCPDFTTVCYRDDDCGLSGNLTPIPCTLVAVAGGSCQ